MQTLLNRTARITRAELPRIHAVMARATETGSVVPYRIAECLLDDFIQGNFCTVCGTYMFDGGYLPCEHCGFDAAHETAEEFTDRHRRATRDSERAARRAAARHRDESRRAARMAKRAGLGC